MTGNLFSRILGLVREQLASGRFGTEDPVAAFQIADNVHTLLFDLVISGMLQAALIPVLMRWAGGGEANRAELRRVTGALFTILLAVVGGAVALGMIFAPQVVRMMTALGDGDTRPAATTALAVDLVRMILPAVLFLAIGTLLMSVLYAGNRVAVPALSLAARNLVVVVFVVALGGRWGVKSMAAGIVAGAVVIAVMNAVPLVRAGLLPSPNLQLRHPGVRAVLKLYAPIFLGLVISTVAVVIDRNLAWQAEAEALGAMRYATTLVQFVLGLVAAAISLAALPALSDHFTRGDEVAFRRTLERALNMTAILILPAIAAMAALSVPIVNLLFRHGATDAGDARMIVIALLGYLPGTLFAAFDQILIYAFYARHNTWWPVLVGVLSTLIFLVLALILGRAFGMIGLVIANSVQFIVHAVVMLLLARRVLGRSEWSTTGRLIGKSTVAGTAAGALMVAVYMLIESSLPAAQPGLAALTRELGVAALPAAIGAILYVALLHALRVAEARELWRLVRQRATMGLNR